MAKNKEQEPEFYYSRINNIVLNYRTYVMSKKEKFMYGVALFLAGGVISQIFYSGLFSNNGIPTLATHISNVVLFVVVGLLANRVFMKTVTQHLHQKRIKQLKTQFRDFLSALSTSLSSGMNVNDSLLNAQKDLQMQYSADSYMVKEVNEMVEGVKNNVPIEDTLEDFGARSGVEDISNFAIVFKTCYRTGGNIKEIIKRTSGMISQKLVINEEVQTTITSNKLQMNMMCVLPIIITLMLKTMSSSFAAGFTTIIGVIGVTVSVCLFTGAFVIGQKIVNIGE